MKYICPSCKDNLHNGVNNGWKEYLNGWPMMVVYVLMFHLKLPLHMIKKNNYSVSADFIALMKKVGFKFFNQLTWDKGNKAGDTCWGSFDSASSPFIRDPAESIIIFYKGNQWKRLEPDPGKKKSGKFRKNEFVTLTQNV